MMSRDLGEILPGICAVPAFTLSSTPKEGVFLTKEKKNAKPPEGCGARIHSAPTRGKGMDAPFSSVPYNPYPSTSQDGLHTA